MPAARPYPPSASEPEERQEGAPMLSGLPGPAPPRLPWATCPQEPLGTVGLDFHLSAHPNLPETF